MEQKYSNREIDRLFAEIKEQLDRIEHQTTKTNGRVNNLENWRSLLLGGWAIITFLVIPILSYIYWEHNTRTQKQIEYLIQK